MTEPVKPVSKRTVNTAAPAKTQKTQKVKIGGIEFRKDQVGKTSEYTKNNQKINTVFLKNGMQIDFPNQTNSKKEPSIDSRGKSGFFSTDSPSLQAYDVENATIYGNPNNTDFINLSGKSSGNEIIVDQKESWYVNGSMQKDYVDLGPDTENNTVLMDKKDKTRIWYNQTGIEMNGVEVQSTLGHLEVEGAGVSSQEEQLQDALTKKKYDNHKIQQ